MINAENKNNITKILNIVLSVLLIVCYVILIDVKNELNAEKLYNSDLLFRNEFLETQNDLLHKCYSEQLEIKEKLKVLECFK